MAAEFSDLVYGTMDLEEPTGWVRLQAVLVEPRDGSPVYCRELIAIDEDGEVLVLEAPAREELARRFVDEYNRGRGRGGL